MPNNIKNRPKLRFPGFTGEWEEKKLGEVTNRFDNLRIPITANKRSSGTVPYYGANGVQDYVTGFTHDGEFILVAEDGVSDLLNYPIYYVNGKIWVNNHAHVVQGITAINNLFLSYVLRTIDFKPYLVGGGRTKLTAEELIKIPVNIPKLREQNQIGAFFQTLDQHITYQQQKLEKLKERKKALLQKMFPTSTQRVPELRFPGFTGEWEEKKIKENFKITRGYVLATDKTEDEMTESSCYPVYSSQTLNDGLMGYYSDFLYENAITWTTDGANAGTVNYRDGKFYCTNVCGVLLENKIKPNKMISEMLNTVTKKYVSYVGNPKLMNNVMAEIEIILPVSIFEQEKISDFLTLLDAHITCHQRQLEHLKLRKKALLQQLFV